MQFLDARSQNVVIVGDSGWTGNKHPWHHLTSHLTDQGRSVTFIGPPPLLPITVDRLRRRVVTFRQGAELNSAEQAPGPCRMEIAVLPPSAPLASVVNRHVLTRTIGRLRGLSSDLALIAYTIGEPVVQLVRALSPRPFIYVSVHHYPTYFVPPAVADTEDDLVRMADAVFADSVETRRYLMDRHRRYVGLTLPGVDYALFNSCADESVKELQVFGYHGTITDVCHDIAYFNALVDAGFDVQVVGDVDRVARRRLSERVSIQRPVAPSELVPIIRHWDAFVLPYRASDVNRGLSPAKIFECCATGKPIFVTQPGAALVASCAFVVSTPEHLTELARTPGLLRTSGWRDRQLLAAKRASWPTRFLTLAAAERRYRRRRGIESRP